MNVAKRKRSVKNATEMNYIEILKYCFYAAAFVLSMFFSIKFLTATTVLREHWRTMLRHLYYLSRRRFNLLLNVLGVVLLAVGLWIGYALFIDLLRDWWVDK